MVETNYYCRVDGTLHPPIQRIPETNDRAKRSKTELYDIVIVTYKIEHRTNV